MSMIFETEFQKFPPQFKSLKIIALPNCVLFTKFEIGILFQ